MATKHIRWSIVGLALAGTAALAAVGYADFLRAVANRESSNRPTQVNQANYLGLFQMGEMALTDAGYYRSDGTATNDYRGTWTGRDGVNSRADFLNNSQAQIDAVTAYYANARQAISNAGLDRFIGQTINGVPITESGLLAGYHLKGLGTNERPGLRQFLESGIDGTDGNGTRISSYISSFGGYDTSDARDGRTGVSFADVQAAIPTGGVGTGTTAGGGAPTGGAGTVGTPTGRPGSNPGNRPTVIGVSPVDSGVAFEAGAGVPMARAREAVTVIAASLLTLWFAWTFLGSFQSYLNGRLVQNNMVQSVGRGVVVVLVAMWFLN